MMKNRCCGTCLYFNGEIGDGEQFCDEREAYVHENGYCSWYVGRTQNRQSDCNWKEH